MRWTKRYRLTRAPLRGRREWRLPGVPAEIPRAINDSREILELRDEDDQPLVLESAWERATTFLRQSARRVRDRHGVRIDVPDILAGPDGSVDLHWRDGGAEMLINVPADASQPVSFYGDDATGNVIKGTIASVENRGLLLWLAKRN